MEKCSNDRELNRNELKKIERRLTDHAKFWTRIMNSGKNHEHLDRILESKICNSENAFFQ